MKHYSYMKAEKSQQVANWVSAAQGHRAKYWQNFNTMAFYDRQGIKVAWLYTGAGEVDIGVHVAARKGALWCYPEILRHLFGYPFQQLAFRRITAPIAAGNQKARRTALALGFKHEGVMRAAELSGDDIVIYGMLRDECRWLTWEAKHHVLAV